MSPVWKKTGAWCPLLEAELASQKADHVRIINADILKINIGDVAGDKKLVVIGNLPYNISSQIFNPACGEK